MRTKSINGEKLILSRSLKVLAAILLICLALGALFYPHRVRAALRIDTVKTQVLNQVRKDDSVARTLQDAISYETPDWNKVIQPQLVKRDEQIRIENERLAKEKAEEEAKAKQAAEAQSITVAQAPPIAQPSGDKSTWMAQAGIPQNLWGYVDFIVTRESGWNPNARNPSGACGLGQQLPCGKWAGAWNDPIAALQGMNSYVNRYGGWAGAVSFWQSHNWY